MWRMSFQASYSQWFSLHIIWVTWLYQRVLNCNKPWTYNLAASDAAKHIKLKGGPLFSCDCTVLIAWSIYPKGLWLLNTRPLNFRANDDEWILRCSSYLSHFPSHFFSMTEQGLLLGDVTRHRDSMIDNFVY